MRPWISNCQQWSLLYSGLVRWSERQFLSAGRTMAFVLMLSCNTGCPAFQHQPLAVPAKGVSRQVSCLSRAVSHDLSGYRYCHASALHLVTLEPFKMNKATLNFVAVNSSSREKLFGVYNKAEHPTSTST